MNNHSSNATKPCSIPFSKLNIHKLKALLMAGLFVLSTFSTSISNLLGTSIVAYAETPEERLERQREIPIESNDIVNWPVGPVVGAESAILIDANTGTILYEKNVHQPQYPASTTKILTCLIAAETCSLTDVVKFSHKAVFDTPRDSNHIAIDEGEKLTVLECIQAILIRSANECSFAIAEHISGGSWEDFADIMNQRAKELGCVDSHFVNPNGLPNEDHYTSAYDLAQIGRAFFANEMLCQTTLSPALHIIPSERQKDEILERNGMQIIPGGTYGYEYLVGCKTGYTIDARSCLVSCAEKNGLKLICVVLRDEAPNQYKDTIALFDYGFSNFDSVNVSQTETRYSISTNNSFYSGKDIFGSSKPILALNTEACILLPKTVSFQDLETEISYDTQNKGQAAIISYMYNDQFLGTASVDFATSDRDNYSFSESDLSGIEAEEKEVETEEALSFIFINVNKILKISGIVIGAGLLLFLIIYIIRTYHFHHPNFRRRWKKERRNHTYRTYRQEMRHNRLELKRANKRRRRGRKSLSRSRRRLGL